MVKIVVMSLLLAVGLALGLWGCDDDCHIGAGCNGNPDLGECPAEDLMRPKKCSLSCQIEGIADDVVIDGSTCESPDCLTLDCETEEGNLVFDLENWQLGTVSIDGGDPVNYDCGFIFVDVCK